MQGLGVRLSGSCCLARHVHDKPQEQFLSTLFLLRSCRGKKPLLSSFKGFKNPFSSKSKVATEEEEKHKQEKEVAEAQDAEEERVNSMTKVSNPAFVRGGA